MRFAIFPVHLSKVLRLPRKIDARSYEVLRLSRKIILANLHIWYSKMQPLSGNERPDLLTSLMNMSLVLRLPRKCIFADPLQMSHACHHSWKCYKTLTFLVTFDKVHNPLRLPRETTSEPPKVARTCGVFVHFDFEMCFAPQRRALFRHLNCQKWSEHGVLVHFDLEMCFVPQRRALFRHLKCQKWSAPLVLLTFWLGNVLCATTACTFSTSQLPKVVRTWCVLCILTWKCASCHNGVHFFNISTSKSGPTMVCFDVFCTFWLRNVLRATTACNFSSLLWPDGSAPAALASLLFDPPGPQIIGKTQWIATFLPFRASPSSFFLLFLFCSSLFWSFSSLCLFPALLFICPYCRKFDF